MKAKKYWAWVGLFFVIALFGFKIFAFADKQEEQDSLVGLRGVYVICDEIRPELERYGLAEELLESDVKSQLRQNGIKLLSIAEWNEALGQPFLYINVNGFGDKDIDFGFVSIEVEFRQVVRLSRDFNTKCFGVTWDKSKVGGYRLDNLKENTHRSVKELVGIFINDYLAANPKEGTKAVKDKDVIKGTGTIRFAEVEGGFYFIDTDSGVSYDPTNLPKEYWQDGLRVKFEVVERPDIVSFHMNGPIVEILKIEKIEKTKKNK